MQCGTLSLRPPVWVRRPGRRPTGSRAGTKPCADRSLRIRRAAPWGRRSARTYSCAYRSPRIRRPAPWGRRSARTWPTRARRNAGRASASVSFPTARWRAEPLARRPIDSAEEALRKTPVTIWRSRTWPGSAEINCWYPTLASPSSSLQTKSKFLHGSVMMRGA